MEKVFCGAVIGSQKDETQALEGWRANFLCCAVIAEI
jgi:hypothetical protein